MLLAALVVTPPDDDPAQQWERCVYSVVEKYAPLQEPAGVIVRSAMDSCASFKGQVVAYIKQLRPDLQEETWAKMGDVTEDAIRTRATRHLLDARLTAAQPSASPSPAAH